MSLTTDFFIRVIAYAIAFVIGAVIMVPRRRLWLRRAYKLAAQSDIALPELLADRVARFLRNEFLFGQFVNVLAVPLVATVVVGADARQDWSAWFPWILAGLPLYMIVFFFGVSQWPRWKASSGYRMTHLGRLPVRHAFTSAEFSAVVFGVVFSAGVGAWGLRYVAAPAIWWLACAATVAAAFAAWHYAAASLMNRPSSASDATELGWDDLLRFRQVRAFTAAAAWGPGAMVYVIDCFMSSAFFQPTTTPGEEGFQLRWWPIIVPIAMIFLLARVFRQGRQLWRRGWLERDEGDGPDDFGAAFDRMPQGHTGNSDPFSELETTPPAGAHLPPSGGRAQGWYADPTGEHEQRWFSAGQPTSLVKDGKAESQDPMPLPPSDAATED